MAKTTCGKDNEMACGYEHPCPEHVQRNWAAQVLVGDLQVAIYGMSFATTNSPKEEWRSMLDMVEAHRWVFGARDNVIIT